LAEEAERLSLSMQELAARRLFTSWESAEEDKANPSFREAMKHVFEKNSELYRRLACLALA